MTNTDPETPPGSCHANAPDHSDLVTALAGRSIVLVGMMGAGKTHVGRRLAKVTGLPFVDADEEIEIAAGCTIAEMFEKYGEPAFRDGEVRVIHRLLESGPAVLSTGGGAFMNAETRANIASVGVSVWLRADLDVLHARTKRRKDRPLLNTANPKDTLARLLQERDPVYALADITVETGDEAGDATADRVLNAIQTHIQRDN